MEFINKIKIEEKLMTPSQIKIETTEDLSEEPGESSTVKIYLKII